MAAGLARYTELGWLTGWRCDGSGKYTVQTHGGDTVLHSVAEVQAFTAGLRSLLLSPHRAEFEQLVAAADGIQSEAERLCDEANESGLENEEFEVREAADLLRAQALELAVQLLGVRRPMAVS